MAIAVIFGAFGAHSLKEMVSEADLLTFEKAVRYHFWHALGLLIIGSIGFHVSADALKIPVFLIMFGIIFFSGSLYMLVITNTRWLGAGYTVLEAQHSVIGWILLAYQLYRA